MSIFKASAARPHDFDDEPRICFVCLSECESNEKYDDCVSCPDCLREEAKMDKTPEYMNRDLITGRIA